MPHMQRRCQQDLLWVDLKGQRITLDLLQKRQRRTKLLLPRIQLLRVRLWSVAETRRQESTYRNHRQSCKVRSRIRVLDDRPVPARHAMSMKIASSLPEAFLQLRACTTSTRLSTLVSKELTLITFTVVGHQKISKRMVESRLIQAMSHLNSQGRLDRSDILRFSRKPRLGLSCNS